MRFRDRTQAGQQLAELLLDYAARDDVVVLGLPRGGVPVAAEVAYRLEAPLDVLPVRKLGLPGHEELALGAIAPGGVRVVNASVADAVGFTDDDIAYLVAEEERELVRRERDYRGDRPALALHGRVAILVDDGLATGASMRAAAIAADAFGARERVVAVPVGASSTVAELAREVDHVVVAHEPRRFFAVGYWYRDFEPTSDDEVRRLLDVDPGSSPARNPG